MKITIDTNANTLRVEGDNYYDSYDLSLNEAVSERVYTNLDCINQKSDD